MNVPSTLSCSLPLALTFLFAGPSVGQELQGPPAPSQVAPTQGPPAPGEVPAIYFLDDVRAVVGPELILRSDLERKVQSSPEYNSRRQRMEAQARRTGNLDEEAFYALLTEVLVEYAESLFMVQGGKDLGFDPGLVQNMVSQRLKEDIELYGGYTEMSRLLSDDQMTPAQYREMVTDGLMAQSWSQAQTGRARGAQGRFQVDREIRPGLMKAAYELFLKSPNPVEQAIVGIESERVVLQELILKTDDYGGLEATIALANGMREVGGARSAFDDLVRNHGAEKKDMGILPALEVTGLRVVSLSRYGHVGLYEFASVAEVDAISVPLSYTDPKKSVEVVHLYRLEERLEAREAQPFVSREVQLRIRRNLQEALDKRRLAEALLDLEQSSFVWPMDLREFMIARRLNDM